MIFQKLITYMQRLFLIPPDTSTSESRISGRIRIEVDGKEVVNKAYRSKVYRYYIIEEAINKYEKISAIYITPDEQPETGQDTFLDRHGVSDIINNDHPLFYPQ